MDEVEKNKEDPVNKEDQNYNQVFIKEEKLNKRCIDENFAFVTADDENDDDSDDNELANFDPKKKYICSFKDCNAQFLRPSRLLRHERQHTGEVNQHFKLKPNQMSITFYEQFHFCYNFFYYYFSETLQMQI